MIIVAMGSVRRLAALLVLHNSWAALQRSARPWRCEIPQLDMHKLIKSGPSIPPCVRLQVDAREGGPRLHQGGRLSSAVCVLAQQHKQGSRGRRG